MATLSKRIIRSYNTYLKERAKWSLKGYGLDRELTLNEYAWAHRATVHATHTKHPARDIASADRTFTRSEGVLIVKRLKSAERYAEVDKEALKALQAKYKKAKDVYSQELTAKEEQAMEEARREDLRARGKEPKYIIQASARARVFNELRDAGLSYKEANKVLYGE